ncbi:RNA polymerase sigma-70 factor [Bacteroides sp. UBA939]|uniref:RNA polymerase sigma-70 factor n=1 Tax=Bacteroides sp. UBA939 TaxID=1946092 RepID=UPI0025C2B61E|nr:RNA polymerase sigma-70 factor [Bacteroides sp. UBA939]
MDDKELVALVKEGNNDAFSSLYRQYWGKVYNFSKLYIRSAQEVEEIVQEVFVKVWETRDRLDEAENFKGYLFIITRNLIFNNFRKSFNEDFYKVSVLDAIEESSCNIEEEIIANNLKEYIDQLIKEMPARQKEVFSLSRENHLSYKEIAGKLDISEKTVERHINEALKYLKRNIKLLSLFMLA